jgi:hydrogenase nickel incorporation protein HypA/HybF
MHELSLLENVREILVSHSKSQNFTKVSKVTLEIGRLSCVEPEALRFAFDVAMKGSLAEDAELILTGLDGIGFCQSCGQKTTMEQLYDACAHCGRPLTVVQGMEMKIKDLVVI